MTYAERVRQARTPQEAMLVLAEAADAILGWLQAQPEAEADPWGTWTQQPEPFAAAKAVAGNAPVAKALATEEAIAAIRDRLAVETDGEERLALEARLRLLTDKGESIDVRPAAGAREQHQDGVVVIPPPTPERQADRIQWAHAHQLDQFSTLPPEEFYPAYGKGGPMWMYAGNRDGVMQMPLHLRRAMILDVMEDSDAAAQEMGRDILKHTGPENEVGMAAAVARAAQA